MMKKLVLLLLFCSGIYFSIPKLNKHLVAHDLLIIPKNILLKKNPLVRSISDLQVLYTKGTVYYLRNGQMNLLKKADLLQTGDILYVKSNGFVILHYAFDSKIKVNPNTIVKIAELKKNLDNFDHSKLNTFVLELGSVLVDYPNYSDDVSMIIKTQRASMGVRGTQFLAALGVRDQSLRVAVDHGLVELKSLNKDTKIEVGSAQGAMIDAVGKAFEPDDKESVKWVKAIDWKQEETALDDPESYEKIHDNQEEIKEQKRKLMIEQIQQFKASGKVINNDNIVDALKDPQHATKKKTEELSAIDEDDLDTNVESVEFNFLKKINIDILAKFAKNGLVPDHLKVAVEEVKAVEESNKKRISELDKIEEEEHR